MVTKKLRLYLALALAAASPALVLTSLGPVAAVAGPGSVVAWPLSALFGLLIAIAVKQLAFRYGHMTGGIGVWSAQVLKPRSPLLAAAAQWGYWLGWSPGLALSALMVGLYARSLLAPDASSWFAYAIAVLVLVTSAVVNHFGLVVSAKAQLVFGAVTMATLAFLSIAPIVLGQIHYENFRPFEPPGGWLSSAGLTAFGGALFLAGWSAYGAEIVLSYSTEYADGNPAVMKSLFLTAGLNTIVYSIVPFALLGVLGLEGVKADPAVALVPFVQSVLPWGRQLVTVLLIFAIILGLNTLTVTSSRCLYQIARNGDGFTFLGTLSSHGSPSGALGFDAVVNLTLLTVAFAVAGSSDAQVPVVLLAGANVGYFVSISLALYAVAVVPDGNVPALVVPRWLRGASGALAVVNVVLIAAAGFAWGFANVGWGALVLAGVVGAAAPWWTRRTMDVVAASEAE
jgi:amino acid transporter